MFEDMQGSKHEHRGKSPLLWQKAVDGWYQDSQRCTGDPPGGQSKAGVMGSIVRVSGRYRWEASAGGRMLGSAGKAVAPESRVPASGLNGEGQQNLIVKAYAQQYA